MDENYAVLGGNIHSRCNHAIKAAPFHREANILTIYSVVTRLQIQIQTDVYLLKRHPNLGAIYL